MCLCADAASRTRLVGYVLSRAVAQARKARRWRVAASGLLLCAVAACFEQHPCEFESCDGRDNDCDGQIDEDFQNAAGLLLSASNCGGCGIVCSEVFPSAAATRCVFDQATPRCVITGCPDGEAPAGDGACVADVPVLCLPCENDDECQARSADARCLPDSGGGSRCGSACRAPADCPTGYRCSEVPGGASQCRPSVGSCACTDSMVGADFACELNSGSAEICAGVQRCGPLGLSSCQAVLNESCNDRDDDCDGAVDETFKDRQGRYVAREHCGGCGTPCVAPGPHMRAVCTASGSAVSCQTDCEPAAVDVDGLAANGCECQLSTDRTPVVGGDVDCDGTIDPTPSLVFVAPGGDDANSGTDAGAALRTIARGIEQGAALGRSVLIARGIYSESVALRAGVRLVGGYSPNFREHDPELYPVLLEADPNAPGSPVLRCENISSASYVSGMTIAASDGVGPGSGSSALLLDGCGPRVELEDLTVLAARGTSGARGADSSDRLADRGLSSLAELAGVDGTDGASGGQSCAAVAAGGGGGKQCSGSDVGGGAGGEGRCAALSCDNSGACGNSGCSDFTQNGVCDIAAARRNAVANPPAQAGRGRAAGRAAEATYDAPTNHGVCSFCDDNPSLPRVGADGGDGAAGLDGVSGIGCGAGLQFDPSGRVQAGSGSAGSDGEHGSGAGGGTAGSGYAVIGGTSGPCSSVAGAAGGGGGSGGCGAPAADGGGGGGASVGIVIRLASGQSEGPRLRRLRIVTASGGDGGDGGIGASGGIGGSGGLGGVSTFWCARNGGRGGDGGPGGAAGGGGGGCGGPSVGVLLWSGGQATDTYQASLANELTVEIAGAAGRGGRGGFSPAHSGTPGGDGVAQELLLAD